MSASPGPAAPLVEHFFRHESGRLAAVLTRFFGWRNIDLVEEMVQAALVEALQTWRLRGVPDNPTAWIRRVASNKVRDALRRQNAARRVAAAWAGQPASYLPLEPPEELFDDSHVADSQLRMIFACCHPSLAREDQIALTLKALCGFGNGEIARALLWSEENVKKRLYRAKQELRRLEVELKAPPADELPTRLDVVHQVLYLLFNEGYCATRGDDAMRTDLCEEAARLCHLLCEHAPCRAPATYALLALMLFHAARLDARLDDQGGVLLLEDQDRARWDRRLIDQARRFLDRSAEGNAVSPYHLEAGIAMFHCQAASFGDTDWRAILRLYDLLIAARPSPVYALNRAIVVAQLDGPAAGIEALAEIRDDPSLARYHLLDATLGELYRRAGDSAAARTCLESARAKTASRSDQELIDRRLALLGNA